MSLNKWLCKHFDDENNGYVTIADVFIKIWSIIQLPCFIIVILFIFFILGGILFSVSLNIYPPENSTIMSVLISLYSAWIALYVVAKPFLTFVFWGTIIVIAFVIICIIGYKVSKIKIAKCELKEKRDKK